MTWTAAGSFGDVQASTFSLTPVTVGNLIVLDVANFSNSTVFASSVSSSNVTWTAVGHFLGSVNTGTHTLFLGTVTSTSAATVTPTWSGTAPAGIIFDYHEFHSSLGAWSADTFTHLDSAGTTTWPSMTPAGSGELYWGYCFNATSAVNPTPNPDSHGTQYSVGAATSNGQAYNLNAPSPVSPVWGDGGQQLGMMVLVQENTPATFPPVAAPRAYPPGWFPGADGLGGPPSTVPFDTPAQPAYAILPPPPVPPPPAAQMRPVPPGWFPGCDAVAAAPGMVPFSVVPRPAASPPKPYIVGLGPGSGVNRWFVDQYGAPRVWVAGEDWGLPANAGSAGTGTWQQDYQAYLSTRAAQGYTVATLDPYGNSIHHGHDDGSTLDGVAPFTTPFNVFNETFWTRIDYLISLAATYGITINLDIAYSYDFGTLGGTGTGTLFSTMTLSQATAYGVALGNRYKNTPNLLWMFGDDDNNNSTLDGLFTNILAGIRSTGDTHEASIEYYPSGTTSIRDLSTPTSGTPFNFGKNSATFNWCYYYWVSYWAVEEAYQEPSFPLPVLWADGFFYDDAGAEPPVTQDNQQIQRNMVWWALSSGARGVTAGSEQVFPWWSAAASGVTPQTSSLDSLRNEAWAAKQAFVVRQLLESLPGWWKLAPDLSSTLVTAGRGTRATYNAAHFLIANSPNSYVTASYVSDGSLAIIYCDAAFSITINQSVMASGYTATWVDPANGTQTATATGSTYSSSGLGNNSAGNPDWLLVLQGTPVAATVTAAGAAAVSVAAAAPTVAVTVTAGVAAVAAAAPSAAVAEGVTAGAATVLAVAPAATAAETVTAGAGIVLVADPGATVSTSSGTTANAGAAAVSVIANAATVAEGVTTGAAVVLAVANPAVPAVVVTAGVAAVAVTAPAATAAEGVTAGAAVVLAAATAAAAAETVFSGVGVINAADPGATVNTSGSTTAVAGPAAVAALAMGPAPAVVVFAGVAAVAVAATAATVSSGNTANAGAPAVVAAAQQAAAAIKVTAGVAAILAAANPTIPPFQVGRSTGTTVTDPRDGKAAVTDPRDGTRTVTAVATSSPGVT